MPKVGRTQHKAGRFMAQLGDSLASMNFMQLLLLFAFVTCYMLAVGGLLGPVWRRRFALLALVLAAGFAALTDPWVHGALLVAFVVAGLGGFVLLSWLLARWLAPRQAAKAAAPANDASPSTATMPLTAAHGDAAKATPKLSRGASAVR